ncbi:MAG: DUF2520 domain-containing protein [bacterium]|nr:DUF2520 domain-containing protein [bacterium]
MLCSNRQGSEALEELAELGASVGSMNLVSESDELRFLIEGDRAAVRLARSLVEKEGGHVTEVLPGSFQLCTAAFALSSWLLQPLMDASVESLRHAGLNPGRAGSIVDLVLQNAVRSYLKAGRRAWQPPRSVRERQAFLRQIESLQRVNPELADYLRSNAIETLRHMGRSSRWLEQTKPLIRRAAAGD